MNHRYTYIYILLAVMLLGASYQLNYRDSREAVCESINERFREEVPYWGDSIYLMRNLPHWGRSSSEAYARKTETKIIGDLGFSNGVDTVVISARYYLPKTYREYQHKNGESVLIWHGEYSPVITDSFFNNLLTNMGIEAEAATELHVKNLKEMFPTADSMNVNAPIREVLVAKHVEGFVTDSVGIGICVRAGGAPGGDDALAMAASHLTGWNIRWPYLFTDMLILLLSLSYIPLDRMAWSLVTVLLSGQIIGLFQKSPSYR